MSQSPQLRQPWADAGYPSLCDFIASADNVLVIRRFDSVHARVILQLQDEISQKEEELGRLDERTRRAIESRRDLGTMRYDPLDERQQLIREVRAVLKEYDDFILKYSQIRARPSAGNRQLLPMQRWFVNNRQAIRSPEDSFIEHGTDVISLVPQQTSIFRQFLEDRVGGKFLSKVFRARDKKGRIPGVNYFSNRGVNAFVSFCAVSCAVLAFIGPLWWLNEVQDSTKRLGIITGFTAFFAIIMACLKVDEPGHAILGTAAYAAVLMVYQQH